TCQRTSRSGGSWTSVGSTRTTSAVVSPRRSRANSASRSPTSSSTTGATWPPSRPRSSASGSGPCRSMVSPALGRVGGVPPFKVVSYCSPAGDQPRAIEALAEGVLRGDRFQTLLGITGSGKSATIAWTIERVQRPTLVIAPNKSLAAQLAQEFRDFFPHNRVEYFVSYYDYYQPEAYIPSSDTYIEKDSSINDEIDRLRHSATSALLARRDVIVVA